MRKDRRRPGRSAAAANSPATKNGTSGCGRFAPPSLVIVFELEAAPKVIAAWSTDEDDWRMTRWLDAHPEYEALLHRAVELSGEELAA